MKVPVRCDACEKLAHMRWDSRMNGWITECKSCAYMTFNGILMVIRSGRFLYEM